MTICFYEDEKYRDFFPLTLTRPVYTLRAGIVPLFKRFERHFQADHLCLSCRDQIAPLLAETFRDFPVNIIKRGDGDVLLLNGRLRDYGDLPQKTEQAQYSSVFTSGKSVVAVLYKAKALKSFPAVATQKEYLELYQQLAADLFYAATTATLYDYCWEIMADVETEVVADYEHLKPTLPLPQNVRVHDGARLVNQDNVFLGEGTELLPTVVIDAACGPVYIGNNVRVEPQVTIIGPCYIGPNTIVLAGRIAGSSIGHTCRVGGEVEESVFQAYVNKYHAGFIGHSYIGQWVNFGAMTTNSDLKNNYSPICLTLNGKTIDSGSIKVGSFIGDHSKFGIGTLLTTGINIGACCNIFGGCLVTDKEVPSFSWGSSGAWERYQIEKALQTARRATERRDHCLSDSEVEILQVICDDSLSDEGSLRLEVV